MGLEVVQCSLFHKHLMNNENTFSSSIFQGQEGRFGFITGSVAEF